MLNKKEFAKMFQTLKLGQIKILDKKIKEIHADTKY